ncbi:hypothetical protein IE53DRAFT_111440 [Violaceomyces palustris]|uniref:Uncharacterized protein n=1 Tax=Violaceomyces palustris TaxID=1673888 RepID=A0ACD0NWD6_9BASI|nr:hypothetical protein IE53DRAFT_111440 [Violaceomyces palustris]
MRCPLPGEGEPSSGVTTPLLVPIGFRSFPPPTVPTLFLDPLHSLVSSFLLHILFVTGRLHSLVPFSCVHSFLFLDRFVHLIFLPLQILSASQIILETLPLISLRHLVSPEACILVKGSTRVTFISFFFILSLLDRFGRFRLPECSRVVLMRGRPKVVGVTVGGWGCVVKGERGFRNWILHPSLLPFVSLLPLSFYAFVTDSGPCFGGIGSR